MQVSVFVGISVDGFMARRDGSFDFLDQGGNEPHGYEEFFASVDASTQTLWLTLDGTVTGPVSVHVE